MLRNHWKINNSINQNIYESESMKCRIHPGGTDITRQLLRESKLEKGKVLDIGCGLGASVAYFNQVGFEAYGLDKSKAVIENAKNIYPQAMFLYGNAEFLQFEKNFFDAVLCECVLSTFQNIYKVLNEIYRVLKPDGLLLWSDICLKKIDNACGLYTLDEWVGAIQKASFKSLRICSADNRWKDFIAELLWNNDDLTDFYTCIPKKVSYKNISYCYGIAQKFI